MDIIIKNGRVIDGNSNPWFRADVGIKGERIARIGDLSGAQAEAVIDAGGMVVSPGFIDIHNHSDIALLADGRAESMVHQGVTTVITGNCGNSPFPLIGDALEDASRSYGPQHGLEVDWTDMAGYEARLLRQGISVNTGVYIGHGTLRKAVMGRDRTELTPSDLEEMKAHIAAAMAQGGLGLSTGLGYFPGIYAETDEIVELAREAARHGGIYSTHCRATHLFPHSLMEAIEVGERAGIPVQMAHIGSSTCQRPNWGRARSVTLNLVDAARARGVDFTADIYPYTISGGGLTMYIPEWAQEGGTDAMLERLANPEARDRMRPEVDEMLRHRGWSQLLLYKLSSERYESYTGKTVQEIADAEGIDLFDLTCDIIVQEGGRAPFMGMFGLEEDIRTLMRHEAVMIGSDGTAMSPEGPAGGGPVHPRNYGTFARVIETYVGGGVLSLPEGVHKMAGMAAWRLGLRDRGIIAPGAYADITIFDPHLVRERYTLTEAPGFPDGIPYVLVNGVPTIEDGEHTGARAGKVIHNQRVNHKS